MSTNWRQNPFFRLPVFFFLHFSDSFHLFFIEIVIHRYNEKKKECGRKGSLGQELKTHFLT